MSEPNHGTRSDADVEKGTQAAATKPWPNAASGASTASAASSIVDFDIADPQNPLNWPYWRKVAIQLLVASMYMLGNFGTLIITPAVPQLLAEFHVTAEAYSTLLVSIWELGEAVGPFIVAPLSERLGRLPVYTAGNVLFIVFAAASALSTNISMLIAFRFLNGLTTTSMTLGPCIVGDCFPLEERGKSMAIALAIPQLGPFLAPAIGGYLTQNYGWRWCMWFVTIFAVVMTSLSGWLVRETYKPKILERKTRRLREATGDESLQSVYDAYWNADSFFRSIVRPLDLLFHSPILFVFAFYSALVYGMSYIILTTLATTMQTRFGFTEGQTGLAYLGRGAGQLIGMVFYGLTSDRYLRLLRKKRSGENKPEDRLPHMILGALTIVIGILLYGWGSEYNVTWVTPVLGTATVGFSMLLTQLPTQNYLVDIFDLYAASAIAISNSLSALFGAFFPLCAPPLFHRLGLGWGNSVLALIFLLWAPALIGLHHFGERLRKRSAVVGEKQSIAS